MSAEFSLVERHRTEPAAPAPGGRIVLSRLPRGDTPLASAATSIKYVVEGEERYEIGGSTIVVRAGQFAVVRPGVAARAILPRPSTGLCLYLPPCPTRTAEPDDLIGPAQVFAARGTRLGGFLGGVGARLMRSPALDADEGARLLGRAGLELEALAQDCAVRVERLTAVKASTRRELFRRADLARAHLHEHSGRTVSLQELGETAGVSPFHLARAFQALYGAPPMAYHARLRMEQALALLEAGVSAAEISVRLGFSKPSAFSRAFKRSFGRSPAGYGADCARSVKGAAAGVD